MKNTLTLLFIFLIVNLYGQKSNPDAFKSMRQTDYKGDINIYYNPLLDKYDISFVKLDLEVTNQSKYISGNATIQAKATEELDTLVFELHSNLIIDSMFLNEIKVSFEHNNNQIFYVFNSPLEKGIVFNAQIFYNGTPPNYGGVNNGYNSSYNKSVTYTLSESFHANEWWPCKQVLSDKIDSAYLYFTCGDTCMVGSNGLLKNIVDLPNNKKRYEWKTFYPINYYLISFAVADYEDYSIYAHPEGIDSVLIQTFVYDHPDFFTVHKQGIDNTIDFMEVMSDKFGLYPFANEKYGHCVATIGGGMEHQTMTTIGSFSESWYDIVSHEIGHMWFGDYVTCASWQDIWINEGLASYTEYVVLENLKTQADAQNWMNSTHSSALSQPYGSVYIPFEDASNENRIFSSSLSYNKGAALVHLLRHEVNDDELFFSSIQSFLSEFGDSVATGEDFKNSFENSTGIDFDPFFNQWYYGKGYPTIGVDCYQGSDTIYMTVFQSTSSSETPLFQLHVDYKLNFSDGDTTLRLFQSENEQLFKIATKKKVKSIQIDPENWILNRAGSILIVDTTNTNVGLESLGKNNNPLFTFGPNPASENIKVFFNSKLLEENKTIQILDLNGRLVYTTHSSSTTIVVDIRSLPKGIYILKGLINNNSYTYKLIKQ